MLSDVSAQREIMSKLPSLMELAHAHAHAHAVAQYSVICNRNNNNNPVLS